MAYLQIVFTNNDNQDKVILPADLGGGEIDPGANLTKIYNQENLPSIARDVRPSAYGELERLVERDVLRTEVDTGIEAAGAQVYNVALPSGLSAGSVIIQIPEDGGGFILMKDDDAGALAEDGGNGTGTINYATGAVVVNDDIDGGTIASSGAILADYRFRQLSAAITASAIVTNGLNVNDIIESL